MYWNGSQWSVERAVGTPARPSSRLTDWLATLTALAVVALLVVPFRGALAGSPSLAVDPTTAQAGARVTISGSFLPLRTKLQLTIDGSAAGMPTVTSDRKGWFSIAVRLPALSVGRHTIGAASAPGKGGKTSTANLGPAMVSTPIEIVAVSPAPTPAPSAPATPSPTATPAPTTAPTVAPTATPSPTSSAPGASPSTAPSPTTAPSTAPTPAPTTAPTPAPTTAPTPTPAPDGSFVVSPAGSDANPGTAAAPWRTIAKAVASAPAGSTIVVRAGTYGPISIGRSHLTILAATGEQPVVSGGSTAIAITGDDVTIRGLRVTGASAQGIWVDGASDVVLESLRVDRNSGHGIQVIRSTGVHVLDSTVNANTMSGIRELDDTTGGRYVGNTVADNGHDGQPYNGDGILLQGSGGLVSGNTIVRNGDHSTYEHGVYAAAIATGYVISGNVLDGNAASGIKAGGSGTVKDNVIGGSVRGVVFAGTGGIVKVTGNRIDAATYAILVTSDCDLGRYQSDYNTFDLKTFGLGGALSLPVWRTTTGLDVHST